VGTGVGRFREPWVGRDWCAVAGAGGVRRRLVVMIIADLTSHAVIQPLQTALIC
jgi:hypothetical protein